MASSCTSPQLNPSKRCLIAPACPVCIMPLFFCRVEGVNCVVRGSLTFLHPPATLCISPNRTTVAWQPFCAQAPHPHFKDLAEESVPWLLSPFVCARCLAHWSDPDGWKVNMVMGKSNLWGLQGLFSHSAVCQRGIRHCVAKFYLATQSYRNSSLSLNCFVPQVWVKNTFILQSIFPCLWCCE